MDLQTKMLWMLRIYGPAPAVVLIQKGGLRRSQGIAALTRLRREKLATLGEPLNYEITAAGRAHLEALTAAKTLEGSQDNESLF